MSGRLVSLIHLPAHDFTDEGNSGDYVAGHARFYFPETQTGWEKITAGRLRLSLLLGGSSGLSGTAQSGGPAQKHVEFYLSDLKNRTENYVAVNLDEQKWVSFGFFGRTKG